MLSDGIFLNEAIGLYVLTIFCVDKDGRWISRGGIKTFVLCAVP